MATLSRLMKGTKSEEADLSIIGVGVSYSPSLSLSSPLSFPYPFHFLLSFFDTRRQAQMVLL